MLNCVGWSCIVYDLPFLVVTLRIRVDMRMTQDVNWSNRRKCLNFFHSFDINYFDLCMYVPGKVSFWNWIQYVIQSMNLVFLTIKKKYFRTYLTPSINDFFPNQIQPFLESVFSEVINFTFSHFNLSPSWHICKTKLHLLNTRTRMYLLPPYFMPNYFFLSPISSA